MNLRIRTLLLGLTTLAIVIVEGAQLTFDITDRISTARAHFAEQTGRLASAGRPLLLNALVVGDLATAEQILRHLNAGLNWRRVVLYEADGREKILDASPASLPESAAPRWLARRLPLDLRETRLEIAAGPRVYAVLDVTPSSLQLEDELWSGIRYTAYTTIIPLVLLLIGLNFILAYGLRPIQELGRGAARLGAGDLSVRIPATGLADIAQTVNAFNTMAANLETARSALEQREAERRKAERRQAARFAVTRVLAETDAVGDPLERILEAIGQSIEWDWGEFWRVDPDTKALRRASIWRAPHMAAASFDAPRSALSIARGSGLLGETWAQSRALWGAAGTADPVFGSRAVAEAAGLTSAFAFPVPDREVIGVTVFFSREERPSDVDLLAVAGDIGRQVGQFLERRFAETTLRDTEEQLRQSQKMEAIGKLAGGVAHDFNNLLTVIIGRCGILLNRLGPTHQLSRDLEMVRTTAERAARLTRQLLAFGRKQVLQPQPLDVNLAVEGIAPMLRRLIGEDVEHMVRLRPGVGRVMADPSQIEQVIVNLVVNARDAMPQGGRLMLETANVDLDAAYLRRHPGSQIGPHVMLAVSDTGVGMDAETRARVFEPFFTTKDPGKGSGLGLSTVYGIVQQSGGAVWVYSEPGQGAVFKVYLPRIDADVESTTDDAAPSTATPRGTETILLVEDQEEVRELARDILLEHGYTVLEAGDPEEAWPVFDKHRATIDLLLTDVVMPRASGRQLADRLAPHRPDLKVLYMSGYTDQAIVQHGVLEAGIAYLEKPFTIDTLTHKVRDVLDAPAVGAGSGS